MSGAPNSVVGVFPDRVVKAPVPASKGSNSGEGGSGLSWRDPSENRVRPIVAWWSENRPPLQRRCTSLNKEGTAVKQIPVSPRAPLWFPRSSFTCLVVRVTYREILVVAYLENLLCVKPKIEKVIKIG